MFTSFDPVLHSLAGKPIDQPGIFDGLLRLPPIILSASFVFILLYNPIMFSCQACGLTLAACRLLLVAISF
jgi:hypothetical protein